MACIKNSYVEWDACINYLPDQRVQAAEFLKIELHFFEPRFNVTAKQEYNCGHHENQTVHWKLYTNFKSTSKAWKKHLRSNYLHAVF